MYENIKFPEEVVFLVTGAAGFIGSNLAQVLLNKGYKVRGLDNFSTGKKSNIEILFKNPLFEFIEGDIRSFKICCKACERVDYVLHQAALCSVLDSIKNPLLYQKVNIGGTLKMMQAALEKGVKRFVYTSSSSLYGDSGNLPKTENKEGQVLSPYALTKKTNEEYGKLYFNLYGLETIALRYFNVFGEKQDPHSAYAAVIPIFIKKLLNNEPPIIYGDGEQSRDFTYIANVIEANLKACLASKEACGQAYNIAYGESVTINMLYKKLCQLLGKNIEPVYSDERKGDIRYSSADINKARKMIGYAPKYDLNKGLEFTIEWYKKYLL